MSDKQIIIVMPEESVLGSWARDLFSLATAIMLIGVGALLDSVVMEILGLFGTIVIIYARAADIRRRHTFDIDGAQAKLDEIKAKSN